MFSTRIRAAVVAAGALLTVGGVAVAQERWKSPPPEIVRILDAPPAPMVSVVPPCAASSRGVLVMTLTTPLMALAPQTADAGPRMTSIWRMSLGLVGTRSHITMPKKSR